jgi:hypothetical protein
MGIDHEPKLIIGFRLDIIKVKKWMKKHGIDDCSDIDEMKEKIPNLNIGLGITMAGNLYSREIEYFLTFYTEQSFITVKDIKNITEDQLNLAKKVFKEIENDELECENVDDIPIFSTLYVW